MDYEINTLSDSNLCWADVDVSIEEPHSESQELTIYPNPAYDEIYIDIRNPIFDIRYSIMIYDMYGRKQKMLRVPERQSEVKIDISNVPPGIYVVALRSESGFLETQKVVIR